MELFRSIYFMPAAISATIIGLIFSLFLNADLGPLNYILKTMGLGSLTRNWLSDRNTVLYVTCAVMIWQYVGYHMVIILAGMLSIPKEIIEAASIDGAFNKNLFHIVMPLCKGTLQICFILGGFKLRRALCNDLGGPGMSSTFLAIYMFKVSF